MPTQNKILFTSLTIILAIGLVIGGYYSWRWYQGRKTAPTENKTQNIEKAGDALNKMIENTTKGTLPSLGTNPLENKPNINPANKANPYTNLNTNPFK